MVRTHSSDFRLLPPYKVWREIVSEWKTQTALKVLDIRIRTILPEEYQDCYDDVQPVSMGSASLKFGSDGKVAWDEIWGSFCDLAMAGGPPHKGVLLEPDSPAEIEAQPERYQQVVEEICRGIFMVCGLAAHPSIPGWVRVNCASKEMAGWLLRAITMENISARCENVELFLPAGPRYRIEKEIKNVITAIAKTCHYWLAHMWPGQQRAIFKLFAKLALESPLVQPEFSRHEEVEADKYQKLCCTMAGAIQRLTGLRRSNDRYDGWLGIECPNVRSAIWMMRALVASNGLARREGTVLFLPVNARSDPDGETVVGKAVRIYHLAVACKVF